MRYSGKTPRTRVVATCGVVKVEPNFVTVVPGSTEISIDLRALDGKVLKKMLKDSIAASKKAAKGKNKQAGIRRHHRNGRGGRGATRSGLAGPTRN